MKEGHLIRCARCKEDKPTSSYAKSSAKVNGYQSYCRPCATERRRASPTYRPPLDKERETQFKYRYGITKADFDQMWEEQAGECAICFNTLTLELRGYAIDHNHETGEVRGLLCNRCNTGLGLFRDNPSYLASAEVYLRERGYESKSTT